MAEIGGSASTKIIGVSVLLTWNVMDIEKNVALDLLDGYQFDNVASAPELSDPDWMLIIPGLVEHFWLTRRRMQSCASASQEEI